MDLMESVTIEISRMMFRQNIKWYTCSLTAGIDPG